MFESRGFFHLDNPFYICLKYYFWSFAVGGFCPLSILFIGVSKPIIIPSGISFLYMSEKLYLSVKKWLGSFSLWVCFGLLKIKASNGRSVLKWCDYTTFNYSLNLGRFLIEFVGCLPFSLIFLLFIVVFFKFIITWQIFPCNRVFIKED